MLRITAFKSRRPPRWLGLRGFVCASLLGLALLIQTGVGEPVASVNPPSATSAGILFTNASHSLAALRRAGCTLDAAEIDSLAQLAHLGDQARRTATEKILRNHTLFHLAINPEMRVKVSAGTAMPELVQNEWRTFLVRIENESGTTAPLQITVLNPTDAHTGTNVWLQAEVVDDAELRAPLSGQPLEYRVVRLRSLVAGKREGQVSLHVGQGTQDLGFRNEVDILFQCQPVPSK